MAQETKVKGKMEIAGLTGPIWMIGWLFTIGYAHLGFWKIVLGLVLWPFFLGAKLG